MNEPVSDYLDYYLDVAPPGRGAVLLTGPWGAGKTYFINAYIARREAKRRNADPLVGPGHLYASLYGVRSVEEISAQFFAQTNPLLSSGVARLIGSAASRFVNTFARGQILKDEDGNAVKEFLTRDIKKLTLVFDDLERSVAPVTDMMGYINTFIEREGTKVILLASETDIPADQRDTYARRKEKVISKTLEVCTDAADVYRVWTKEMRNASAQRSAEENEVVALRTFSASGSRNLRSLRAVLDDFDRVVGGVDEKLARSEAAHSRLLSYMIATGTELRAGALKPEDLHSLSSIYFSALVSERHGRDLSPERKALVAMLAKYPEIEWSDSIVPPQYLAKLYTSGIVDRDPIDAAIGGHPLVVEPESVPSWRVLWRWSDLDIDEYNSVRLRFLTDLSNRAFIEPGPILHAAGLAITLKANGDDLLDGRGVSEYFRDYIAQLEELGTLVPIVEALEDHEGSGHAGLGFMGREADDFRIVHELLVAAVQRSWAKFQAETAPRLFEALRESDEQYSRLYEYGPNGVGADPILHYISIDDFAGLCLKNGRLNGRLLAALNERYRRDASKELHVTEGVWLDKLDKELSMRAGHLPAPHRSRASKLLQYYWKRIENLRDRAVISTPSGVDNSAQDRKHEKNCKTDSQQTSDGPR